MLAPESGWRLRGGAILCAVVLVAAGGCSRGGKGGRPRAAPVSDDDKAFYTLGLSLARQVTSLDLNAHEVAMVQAGLADSLLKRKLAVDPEAQGPRLAQLEHERTAAAAEREKAKGRDALVAAQNEPGAIKAPEGFVIKTTHEGTGPTPAQTDQVKVSYEGRFVDGTIFDSSIQRAAPVTFPLGTVIACWQKGIARMKVGEKAKLTCPSDVAYGDVGRPPMVPGGATLVFDLELLEIGKKAPAGQAMASAIPPMPANLRHGDAAFMKRLIDSRPPQAKRP
jgi:FKBP-type peptidyl-prolyl cis-trans isomerase